MIFSTCSHCSAQADAIVRVSEAAAVEARNRCLLVTLKGPAQIPKQNLIAALAETDLSSGRRACRLPRRARWPGTVSSFSDPLGWSFSTWSLGMLGICWYSKRIVRSPIQASIRIRILIVFSISGLSANMHTRQANRPRHHLEFASQVLLVPKFKTRASGELSKLLGGRD